MDNTVETEAYYQTNFVQSILAYRRRKRVDFVLSKVRAFGGMSILDVGCGPNGRSFEDFIPADYKIVGVDLLDQNSVTTSHPNFRYFRQDAQDLHMFNDNEFDLTVSFGMMEHICDPKVLNKMYTEIDRVSRQWAIIVPWKYAYVEPHFKFPFFQLFPYPIKVWLVKVLNLHDRREAVKNDYHYIKKNYQWLTSNQWLEVFKRAKCFVTPHLDTIAIIKA